MSSVQAESSSPLAAMVGISAQIPEQAMTAALLGTERAGHGVRIRADGLIATVGYVVMDAEQIWVTGRNGRGSPAYVIAQDFDSGIGLLKTTMPVGTDHFPMGTRDLVSAGDPMTVYRHGETLFHCEVAVKREFTGRWEYMLEEALYTTPPCNNWAGAALVGTDNRLYGIGSLLMDVPDTAEGTVLGNMFIPIDLVAPYLDELCEFGQRNKPPRPWLGTLIQEHEGNLVVTGVYRDCPADLAGIKPGDFILCIDDEPVNCLSDMFRKVWSMGSAGVEIPVVISTAGEMRSCLVNSIDRATFHQRLLMGPVN